MAARPRSVLLLNSWYASSRTCCEVSAERDPVDCEVRPPVATESEAVLESGIGVPGEPG